MKKLRETEKKPWCVKHRDGWCIMKNQPPTGENPDENQMQVETACKHHIMLPFGFEQRTPDCTECLTAGKKEENR